MAVVGPVLADRRPSARSRVTNGKEILPGIDWRSPTARRYRDLVAQIVADQGGADRMSESRLQLIRRFAAAAVMAERAEADLANGKQIDVNEHALLCSTLVRLANRIGIDRRSKNLTPTVADYIEAVADE
jgi:hypothetical protein